MLLETPYLELPQVPQAVSIKVDTIFEDSGDFVCK